MHITLPSDHRVRRTVPQYLMVHHAELPATDSDHRLSPDGTAEYSISPTLSTSSFVYTASERHDVSRRTD